MERRKPTPWEDEILDERLRQAAHVMGNEFAWKRKEAVEVAEKLQAKNHHIAGIDTYVIEGGKVFPICFSWDAEKLRGDPRFPPNPGDFIRNFDWSMIPQQETREPYFSFTV